MCGIFGLATSEQSPDPLSGQPLQQIVRTLFKLSQQRGQDASGIATYSQNKVSLYKDAISPQQAIKQRDYLNLEASFCSHAEHSSAIMGHARMVTSGEAELSENNHPLQRNGISMIHNGIICNAEEILAELQQRYPRQAQVDTEALLLLLVDAMDNQQLDCLSAIQQCLGKIEGTVSASIFCEHERALFLATNNGSLYYCYDPEQRCLIFASEKYSLQTALKHHPELVGKVGNIKKCPALQAMRFDLNDGSLQQVALSYRDIDFPTKHFTFDKEKVLFNIKQEDLLEYDEELIRTIKRCNNCLLPYTYPNIEFDHGGVCNYCNNMTPTVVQGQSRATLEAVVQSFSDTNAFEENCVIPLSGGRDSCYGAWVLTKEFGVKPITYTYDWGMVTDLSRRNAARVCGELGLENILVSANIKQKLGFIRKNVGAWLRKPDLGLIPLFMAGDKHFFAWVNRIKQQNDLDLNIWMMSPLENADFKEGFAGVKPHWVRERTDFLSPWAKIKMLSYYGSAFLTNPRYINESMWDTATGFFSFYMEPRNHYYNLFDFIEWEEEPVHDVLYNKLGWENSADSPNSWRIGDGTAPFYNYIYQTVAGFNENDAFRSNQIRNGTITRDQGLELVVEENIPRHESLQWYFQRIGLDYADAIRRINAIPKHYHR